MKIFGRYCQDQTEHNNYECLECESVSSIESVSDFSNDEYESDFIDDSEIEE